MTALPTSSFHFTSCAPRGLNTFTHIYYMGKGKRNQGGAGVVGGQNAYVPPNQPYQGPTQGNQPWQAPYNPSKPPQVQLSSTQRGNLRQQIIFAVGDASTAFSSNSSTPCTVYVKIRSLGVTTDDVVREFTQKSTEIPHSDPVARHVRIGAYALPFQVFCELTVSLSAPFPRIRLAINFWYSECQLKIREIHYKPGMRTNYPTRPSSSLFIAMLDPKMHQTS